MLICNSDSYNPFFNLASEEYFFRRLDADIIFIYINDPAVIIGKHQNAYEEVNLRFIREKKIPMIRRISGGGAVYHDRGNLNFSFITNRESGKQVSFEKQTEPVIRFLEKQGLKPVLGEKNEIREGGLKFSGNAEHIFKNRVLHHGTILFNSKLSDIGEALKRGKGLYKSRAVKSNRTTVGNLSPLLAPVVDIKEFRQALSEYLSNGFPGSAIYSPEQVHTDEINRLVSEKYVKDEWNIAYGPPYQFNNTFQTHRQEITLRLEVADGIITQCFVSGNAMWQSLSAKLPGLEHRFEVLSDVIKKTVHGVDENLVYNFFY